MVSLEKELEKTRKQIDSSSRMLANERFVANAPEQVKLVKQTLSKSKELEQNILDSLKNLILQCKKFTKKTLF